MAMWRRQNDTPIGDYLLLQRDRDVLHQFNGANLFFVIGDVDMCDFSKLANVGVGFFVFIL